MKEKTVCVIGLGYIGLPTAALLAKNNYHVIGVDLNPLVVETINQGRIHIIEADLDVAVRSAVLSNRLKAFVTPQQADIYMICVPTPFHAGGDIPLPNIDYILSATMSISHLIKDGDLIILESTCPVGTTQKVSDQLVADGADVSNVFIAYCPERVLPGRIMVELVENDRVVGGLTEKANIAVSEFYSTFVLGSILTTNANMAEMCKLTENSFRDVNIAFANELSLICEKDGIDVWNLIELANRHPRVNILNPGVGVGGHCIAVDPWFIVSRDPENAKIIRCAREVNNNKTKWVINKIVSVIKEISDKKESMIKVGCLGLSFKPNIDDLRESPAMLVVESLLSQGYDVVAVEPNIKTHKLVKLVDLEGALNTCDVLVLLVKHAEFVGNPLIDRFISERVLDFCGALN